MSITAAPEARPPGLPADEPALVLALESELEQARTALSALEEARASERLSRVEADLIAHPYLPQATFLMGECLALQAQAARAKDPGRALSLELRRAALEGPRAPAFGETALTPIAAPAPPRPRALHGLSAADQLEVDGQRLAASQRSVELSAGLHQLRVSRHDRLIFARFVDVQPEQTAIELGVPPLVACSTEDLEGVTANQPLPPGIACERWAQVRADAGGGIGVALCERDHCRAFTHWQRRAITPFQPLVTERAALPAWAGFALAGASALVASGLVLWQAGAFDHGHPTATTWQYGGLNPQGVRF